MITNFGAFPANAEQLRLNEIRRTILSQRPEKIPQAGAYAGNHASGKGFQKILSSLSERASHINGVRRSIQMRQISEAIPDCRCIDCFLQKL